MPIKRLHLLGLAALSACVEPAPLVVPADHPASPAAPSGVVDLPSALGDYVPTEGFTARAAADAAAPPHGGHGALSHGRAP